MCLQPKVSVIEIRVHSCQELMRSVQPIACAKDVISCLAFSDQPTQPQKIHICLCRSRDGDYPAAAYLCQAAGVVRLIESAHLPNVSSTHLGF